MLYLIDKPLAEIGFRAAAADDDARIVLIQDGVFLDPAVDAPTYAVERDLDARGVTSAETVEPISYERLLDLILDHEVNSFV
jgi:tRNA 2-thiouridine synthesizing protein B